MRRSVLTVAACLFATAAHAFELPINGDFGDVCGGTRAPRPAEADGGFMLSRDGYSGQDWSCEFIRGTEITKKAMLMNYGGEGRAWLVEALCAEGAERVIVHAFVRDGVPFVTVRSAEKESERQTLGLCPVRLYK